MNKVRESSGRKLLAIIILTFEVLTLMDTCGGSEDKMDCLEAVAAAY